MHTGDTGIAIIGAGIAGATLAAALSRAEPRYQLFEQAESINEIGAGVQLAPNASRLLHRLGLRDYLASAAVRPEAIELRRWDDGRLLARTELGHECERVYGAPYYTVHRHDLQRGLLGLLPRHAVRGGSRCTAVAELPGEVAVRFGRHAVRAGVVVGADGIHSVVRESLSADATRFSGQRIYRGLVPAEALSPWKVPPRVQIWLGPRQHCVCYPVRRGDLINFAATAPAEDWRVESWSAPGRVADLLSAYSGWHENVTRVLGAASAVTCWALHDRDNIERWSTDRVTLAGDAAHPMLPFMAQGANQAIEDAISLAAFLRAAGPDEVASALHRYEQIRMARTAEVQQRSRANSTTFHLADGQEQENRDAAIARAHDLASMAWLYGYDAEKEALACSAQ